jgi:RNA polymerase sigma factor (sigma-70 family)
MARVKITAELVEHAIAGDTGAVHKLIQALTPLFMYRIGRVLFRNGFRSRHLLEDACQDTFVALLVDDGRLLRAWDPLRGMSFENYSGLIAKRIALNYVRQMKDRVFDDEQIYGHLEPAADSSKTPERLAMSRQMLERIFEVLKTEQSALGQRLFELLFIEARDPEEVCAIMSMKKGAVYVWRSRLGLRIEEIAATLGAKS